MKILNLYAGIGGNRKLWPEEHEVTAVELDPQIAALYKKFFPKDTVLVEDAHEYLLNHYDEYDFIWSSPPCPSHSAVRFAATMSDKNYPSRYRKPIYPDMKLYQEIIFLQSYCKTSYCVENVKSYYDPLITPQISGRHYFWSNFIIPNIIKKCGEVLDSVADLEKLKGFNVKGEVLDFRKDQLLRNCVDSNLGLHILNAAFKEKQHILEAYL